MSLRDQLQASLGTAFTLGRELGGGGMSRVFVATETALGRQVVVKVLPPELTQGVSVERFNREIQLAAQLQHPHIVPVHTAGEMEGLPYYTMPLVDGASLRSRISRGGPMPIGEVVSILREVSRALAYAHERGVVHRDIKPDNVLLTGGSAVVTDFGIAKALSASRSPGEASATLTSIGTSLGTPAYMAPEQAAADPSADSRSDLYSLGCMGYEMLTGRPPFVAKTPQRLLAAHMAETPQPITELRADTPPLLAELVMRCLAKDADNRPQSANDIVKALDAVTTSGGAHPALSNVLLGGRPRLWRALSLYAMAFIGVAIVAKASILAIGLPTWVFPGALIIMGLGLPAILFTAFVHHGAHQALTMAQMTPRGSSVNAPTMTQFAVKASRWVSWRRTTLGGTIALGAFMLLVGVYMVTRAMGIGPAGSLMAAGVLGARERILIADFKSPSTDSTLGPVVTEAFRSEVAQSPSLDVMQPTAVRGVLRRMQKSPDQRIDHETARGVATREGVKAFIDGEVLAIGGSYVISGKLYSATTDSVLATFRQTAVDQKDIIGAIDRLARDVRTKVGEPLKSINSAPQLERVTTASLEALRKYVQGVQVFREGGDFARGIGLLNEAVTLDTGFAMAYRKLSVEYQNHGGFADKTIETIQNAYDHRERLSESEQYLTAGSYFRNGPHPDESKSIAAYEQLLQIQPNNSTALNNLAVTYVEIGRSAAAESLARRAVAVDSNTAQYHANVLAAVIDQGRVADAGKAIDHFEKNVPASFVPPIFRASLVAMAGNYDSAEALISGLARARGTETDVRQIVGYVMSDLERTKGRPVAALRAEHDAVQIDVSLGSANRPLDEACDRASSQVWFGGDPAGAVSILDRALTEHPLDRLPAIVRPYRCLVSAYALAGRVDRARPLLAAYDNVRRVATRLRDGLSRAALDGDIAMAEKRYGAAVESYRSALDPGCAACGLPYLARAYDLNGQADSAIAVYARYAEKRYASAVDAQIADGWFLGPSYKRLGELAEAKGDRQTAAKYYTKFVELWKNAEPELQPQVAEVRKRLARLGDLETRR